MENEKTVELTAVQRFKIKLNLDCAESTLKSWERISMDVLGGLVDCDEQQYREEMFNAWYHINGIVSKAIAGEYDKIKNLIA